VCCYYKDIAITTDCCQHPAVSAHTITLTVVANGESLVFTVPWPFLVDGIESKREVNKKKRKKWFHLVMKKSLNDAWPTEFSGRSKLTTRIVSLNPGEICQATEL
jgi:hypothetical protein